MIWCLRGDVSDFNTHEAAANLLQGHVGSIQSAEENWLVADIAGARAWIGFVDYVSEGSFVWTDGSDVTFTSWDAGEPNNYNGNEDCTTIYWNAPNEWNDFACSNGLPAVYKLPLSSLCGAKSAGYTCYEGDSTGCSSSLNCKKELTTCPG
eukprot:scaffold331115_cov56-Attheya_sp.AAC.1